MALPVGYSELLADLKAEVRRARLRVHLVANTELLELYRRIGAVILRRQEAAGWGARVIDRLGADLRAEFPDMTGLSRSNLKYMRQLAACWPEVDFGQHPVGQLPWGHVTVLLDKLADRRVRDWYAGQAAAHGWSRAVLADRIKGGLHTRIGAAPSNFPTHLDDPDAELAQQLVKDPYIFDFLGLTGRVAERELEQALMDRLRDFLLELGQGFTFAGRQVHFEVDGEDFYLDLLFFHATQLRWIVVELKIDKFRPEHAGQLGFYVAWVDTNRRDPAIHRPTVGILLCADRNERVVRYSLSGAGAPLAVATYTYDGLPAAEQRQLPDANELAAVLDAPVHYHGRQVTLAEAFNDPRPPEPEDI